MQSELPIPIERHALGTLAYIRRSIDMSGSLAVPGMAGVVMGSIGLLAALLASTPQWAPFWPTIWMFAGATAFLVGGALMARETALSGHARYLGRYANFCSVCAPRFSRRSADRRVMARAQGRPAAGYLAALVWLRVTLGEHRDHPSTIAHRHHGRALRVARFAGIPVAAQTHTFILGIGFGALHVCLAFWWDGAAVPTRAVTAKRQEAQHVPSPSKGSTRPLPAAGGTGASGQSGFDRLIYERVRSAS